MILSEGISYYYLCNNSIEDVIVSFAYILYFAIIVSEQIYNAFVIAVKTMINNILFLVNWAREVITFCHINTHLTMLAIDPADLSKG